MRSSLPHGAMLVLFSWSTVHVAGRITGFHIDDESCSGLLANNRTAQEIACQKYFTSLTNLSASLKNYSVSLPGPPLTLTVDAGTAWSCPQGRTNCFNMTFNGSGAKSVAEHVVDLVDQVLLSPLQPGDTLSTVDMTGRSDGL